jgi:amino acid adenylation domain-containing protein
VSEGRGVSSPAHELRSEGDLRDLQLLLWLGQRLAPDAPGYSLPFAFEIRGELDPAHFEIAVRAFVERCDATRMIFEEVDGRPRQRVVPAIDVRLERRDFSGDGNADARLEGWLAERVSRAFRLEEQLFDTALVRMAPERFVWYWNQHHLTADGWSYGLMLRRVGDYYRLSREGRLAGAAELPSFAEYLAQAKAGRALRARSAGAGTEPASAPLEWYGRAEPVRSLAERRITRRLGAARTRALHALAADPALRSLGAELTVLELLAAATAAYAHRVTGARRIALGIPFHHRSTAEEREVCGLLQEMIPLDLALEQGETLRSLAAKVDAEVWRSLRRVRHGAASAGGANRYEILLNYPAVTFAEFDGLPVHARWVHPGFGDGQRSLFVQIQDFDGKGELVLHFDANASIFAGELAERAADHLVAAIDRLIEDPDQPIDRLDLLRDTERELVVRGFNRTSEEYPAEELAGLFETQVAKTPHREALAFGDHSLTYAELDRAANRLARFLRGRGAAPGVCVASCVERSVESVIGLLAVWKCGAAHVPVDPAYPRERIAFLLEDSASRVLLTQERWLGSLPATRPDTVVLDRLDLPELAGDPPERSVAPTDLAYVIYTSGSTGRPKGVAMSQRALVNLVRWQVRQPTPLDVPRTLQFTPLTFDVSMQEMLSTWAAGGTLVLIPDETRRDPEATLRWIDEQRVERLFVIFTPFQRIAEAADRTGIVPRRLREVITAGEQLQITPAVRRFFERLPGCSLTNQYGPSETHIVTAGLVEGAPSGWPSLPSIGRPIANTEAYVLDDALHPVPVGVSGELWIGGAQVAEGYVRRGELTAERFVPDPFRGEAGTRLYKTGDLARWNEDGSIAFLGRRDHQIKLRGYRIELGEIESVLAAHPEVGQAAALARGNGGETRLLAWVVARGESDARLPLRLRRWLEERLPEPMVPSAFVVLDALPVTPNGKVDRLALPEPDGTRPELESAYVAPATSLERTIAEIWRSVLGVDRVGLRDNFFDLGGHSLLLVEVHDALRPLVQRPISVVDLFHHPTVEALAAFLDGARPDSALESVTARAGRQREAFTRARQDREGRRHE